MRVIFFILIIIVSYQVQAEPSAREALERDVQYFEKSLNKKEYRQVAHMTHPTIVKEAGGVVKLSKILKELLSPSSLRGSIKSMHFKQAGKITKIANGLIAIVPYEATFEIKGQLFVVESFYLAWSGDKGKIWLFLDGIGAYRQGAMEKLFPGYKGELTLPEKKNPYRIVK